MKIHVMVDTTIKIDKDTKILFMVSKKIKFNFFSFYPVGVG